MKSEGESTDSDTSSSDYEKVVQPIYQKKIDKRSKSKILTVSLEGDISQFHKRHRAARRVDGCRHKPLKGHQKQDFHTSVIINNSLVTVLVDTGADVNIMSTDEATTIGIPWRKSKIKLRPYGSKP